MGRTVRDGQLTQLQLYLLAHLASGMRIGEAAQLEHISKIWAEQNLQQARKKLNAPTIPACIMRAHALGLLSHPTGYSEKVFVIDVGLNTPALSLASSS